MNTRISAAVLVACGVALSSLDAHADRRAGLFHAARVPGLDASDLRRAQDGMPVTRTLEGADAREVVAIGAAVLAWIILRVIDRIAVRAER